MLGKKILHYKILEKLGEGGMGIVYLAEDTKLKRKVAIKFLPKHISSDKEERKRFEIEAQSAASLNHPNVATIYAIEEAESELFIVMEFIEGVDLKNKIKLHTIPIDEATSISMQIAEGLKAAHKKEIIHRDIKSSNIMITGDGKVKIMDFGLAKVKSNSQLTQTGTTLGTAAYMSPEQARGETVDHRTDIWSLGVVFYEMLSGSQPFKGDYEQAIVYSILNEQPDPIQLYRKDIPALIKKIVAKTLAKKPIDRYQNCEQLLDDLKSCFQPEKSVGGVGNNQEVEKEPGGESFNKSHNIVAGYVNQVRRQVKIFWGIILAVLILAVISTYIFIPKPNNNLVHGKKIAVLPFINLSSDPDDEYFSDGIMEDILTQLVKISDLRVVSRTTMMRYKNTDKTISEISKELNTDVVLEGSVRRDSNQLRVSVQLIDAKTDEHLWAETYDEKPNRVFFIQSEIALKIANTLQAQILQAEKNRLEKTKNYNPEIYNLIVKGRYFVNKLDSAGVAKAIELYSEALSIEPNDANVWTSLANAYTVQAEIGIISVEEGYSKARTMVEKALILDDELAIAHTVLGMIKMAYDWDWLGAEKEFQKAIKIEPYNITTLNQMGQLAQTLGKTDEAIILMQRAVDLEPVVVINYLYLAQFQIYANHLDDAINTLRKGLELNPQFLYLHYLLGCAYLLKGETDKSIVEMESEPVESYKLYGLPLIYKAMGKEKEADIALKNCISKYQNIGPYNIAQIYSYFGNTNLAFDWLEKAYKLKDGSLPYIKGDPFLKNIEKDPRYVTFLKKMKLPL